MKVFVKAVVLLFLIAIMLTSCNGLMSTPMVSSTKAMATATSTVMTAVSDTPFAISTATSTPTLPPSPSPLPPSETTEAISNGIVYYYFVQLTKNPAPVGSVLIMPNTYMLAPTTSNRTYSSDIAADLKVALEAALNDERNGWVGNKLEIKKVAFSKGRVDVVLQGEYFGVGSVTLIAARMQILLTLFANSSVQTATVTLNGDTIGNIEVSNSQFAKPADYVYTRSEIETFMAEHAYVTP